MAVERLYNDVEQWYTDVEQSSNVGVPTFIFLPFRSLFVMQQVPKFHRLARAKIYLFNRISKYLRPFFMHDQQFLYYFSFFSKKTPIINPKLQTILYLCPRLKKAFDSFDPSDVF